MNAAFRLPSHRPLPRAYGRFETLLAVSVMGYFGAALLNLIGG